MRNGNNGRRTGRVSEEMDPRLLHHYERELAHLREVGKEFAKEFPARAAGLGLDTVPCPDPYVERLLEGFAFLAARVQLEISAQYPHFTNHLLEMVYPHFLAPIPSMAVVHFEPDLDEAGLGEGFVVPRGTELRGRPGKGDQNRCTYRTAHDVMLWPVELTEADYKNCQRSPVEIPAIPDVRDVLLLRLKATTGFRFSELSIDSLTIFLRGETAQAIRLYEQFFARVKKVIIRPPGACIETSVQLDADSIEPCGFDDGQSLFPYGLQSFQGYRLLHEYFAFPQRFLFVKLAGLAEAIKQCPGDDLEIIVAFDQRQSELENAVQLSDLSLFCTPAINLFPKRADRIHLRDDMAEYHVVPDRTCPTDYEVFGITEMTGYGSSLEQECEFFPFYALRDIESRSEQAYYTLRRLPRLQSKVRGRGRDNWTKYSSSEAFVMIVDGQGAPFPSQLRQLGLSTLCTNRDLPLRMPVGEGDTDFTLQISAPVKWIRCVTDPTAPRPSLAYKTTAAGKSDNARIDTAWRLINHLSLNYLSIADTDQYAGAAALRELLRLYANDRDAATMKQIEGVRSIRSEPAVMRVPIAGPMAFGRGLRIFVTFDESSFEGTGIFLLGSVLERFFPKYATINSMTETILWSTDRGEVMRWPVRTGKRHTL